MIDLGKSNKIFFSYLKETMRCDQIIPTGIKHEFRYGVASQIYKGKVYIFGGELTKNKEKKNETFSYDLGFKPIILPKFEIENNILSRIETIGEIPSERGQMASILHLNNMIILGGHTNDNVFDIFSLELGLDKINIF